MQSWVASQYLPSRARSRVTVKDALNVGMDACKHKFLLKILSLPFCLRCFDHGLSNTSENMDFFGREVRSIEHLIQSGHEFFRG